MMVGDDDEEEVGDKDLAVDDDGGTKPKKPSSVAVTGYHYGDVFVRPADEALFGPGEWLNDTCIAYAMEYFLLEAKHTPTTTTTTTARGAMETELGRADEKGKDAGEADSSRCHWKRSPFLYLPPSCMQMVHFLPPAQLAEILLSPNGIEHKRFVCCALNDGVMALRADAGSHWALLVYDILHNTAYLFDSFPSQCMKGIAVEVAAILHEARLCCFAADPDADNAPVHRSSKQASLRTPEFVLQTNSHDCGMYVIEALHHVVSSIGQCEGQPVSDDSINATRGDVATSTPLDALSFAHLTPEFISMQRRTWSTRIQRRLPCKRS